MNHLVGGPSWITVDRPSVLMPTITQRMPRPYQAIDWLVRYGRAMIDFDCSADGIATIVLNRPEKMNALDTADLEALVEAYKRVRDDPSILVAIISGTGETSFCAGM